MCDKISGGWLSYFDNFTNALRALFKSAIDRSPDFLRLANVLSALYPRESEEKRLLDAMPLAVPR
jgi:putative DNA methylase